MRPADGIAQLQDLVVAELDDPVADGTVQMVVRRVAVVVLVRSAVGEAKLTQQAGLDEQPEGSIDRCTADRMPSIMHIADKLVGVEMFVRVKNLANQNASGFRQLFAPDFQKFTKFCLRAFGHGNWCQFVGGAAIGHLYVPETLASLAAVTRSVSPSKMILHSIARFSDLLVRRYDREKKLLVDS